MCQNFRVWVLVGFKQVFRYFWTVSFLGHGSKFPGYDPLISDQVLGLNLVTSLVISVRYSLVFKRNHVKFCFYCFIFHFIILLRKYMLIPDVLRFSKEIIVAL